MLQALDNGHRRFGAHRYATDHKRRQQVDVIQMCADIQQNSDRIKKMIEGRRILVDLSR